MSLCTTEAYSLASFIASLKVSTEADGGYCAAGGVERWEKTNGKMKQLQIACKCPSHVCLFNKAKYCIDFFNCGHLYKNSAQGDE